MNIQNGNLWIIFRLSSKSSMVSGDDGDQKVWSQNKGESKVREAKSPNCFTIVH